jgi:hypothetical protein
MGMNPLAKIQAEYNRGSLFGWQVFAGHRQRVTELLGRGATPGSRLCVLGAGNANDLDLAALMQAYREVHLVDLDADAMARGAARQGVADNPGLHRHGGIDLTGALDALAALSPASAVGDDAVAACAEEPVRSLSPALPGPFDVAASTCLLSQLIAGVVQTVGEGHPRFLDLVQALRLGHLRLLTHLVAPGGLGLLITDIVSSDSFPALPSVAEEALPGVLAQLVRGRNFFHGLNPAVLGHFAPIPSGTGMGLIHKSLRG